MSVMRRMKSITVATINDKLEKAEDPVRVIDQFLMEQAEQIRQTDRLYQQCVSHSASLKQKYEEAEYLRSKREEQAMLALKAGEEQLAKLAIQEKLTQEETSLQYKELYDQSMQTVAELEEQLTQLKADYQEVYYKRQYYAARLETVRLQKKMNEYTNKINDITGGHVFHRLEERVTDMELETKALRDVRKMGQEVLFKTGTAVQQVLEQELQALKRKLEWEGGKAQ